MSIFPSSPNIGDQYSGYEWDGTAWKVIGIDLNTDYATAQELADALADTTAVHGISDTSLLETQSGAQAKADAAETSANSYTDTAIASFEALPDQTGHSGEYLTTDGSVTSWGAVDVSGEIATHNADTTDVHGIADTSALVVTTDSRLSDARTPTAHASSHASGGSDAVTLAISQVTGLQTALDGKVDDSQVLTNVPLGAVFTDTTTNETITLSGDVSGSGTSSIVVTVADDSHNHIIGNVDGLQTALDTKAPLASPTLTGTPTAPTAVSGTNTTQIATTAFVASAVSGIIDSAPTTLDTLNELAAALGDDPNFATTVTNLVATKQPLDADLTAIAGLAGTSGFLKKTAVDTWTLDTNTYLTGNQTITLSGDVSGSGTTSISVTVADDSHNHIISNVDGLQLALDAKLDSTSYTASDVLTKIKTVDGSGSGLDADLLDGINSARIVYGSSGSATTTAPTIYDVYDVTQYKSGFWDVTGASWTPTTDWYWGFTSAHVSNGTSYNFGAQQIIRNGAPGDHYIRVISNGTPGSWVKSWNASNDGSGSGLDADLLDGLELHTARNNEVNKVVRTDANGYIQAGWINTTSGSAGTTTPDRIYASYDAYLRYYTPANFISVLNLATTEYVDANAGGGFEQGFFLGGM